MSEGSYHGTTSRSPDRMKFCFPTAPFRSLCQVESTYWLIGCLKYINLDLRQTRSRFGSRSGQVKSECLTCTFRASCCSARLSLGTGTAFVGSSIRDRRKRGEGVKGDRPCTGGYKGVRAVRPESIAGGGWFDVLWNLECPVGLSQMRNMCAFQ